MKLHEVISVRISLVFGALRKSLAVLAAAALVIAGSGESARAAALFGLITWTSGTVTVTRTVTTPTGTITTTVVVVIIDPPSFSNFDITLDYNPALFDFVGSGTLCDFGVGGDCPAVDTTQGTISPIPMVSSLTLGSKLPGSTLSVTDNGTSVALDYDLTGVATPPVAGADENFFGLVFEPKVPLENTVTIQSTPGAYDLSFASVSCTLSSGGSCMTDAPTYGFSFTVPEPSTWAMMLIGFGGLGYAGWRRSASFRRHIFA
jgi:PEP-CTERM motif